MYTWQECADAAARLLYSTVTSRSEQGNKRPNSAVISRLQRQLATRRCCCCCCCKTAPHDHRCSAHLKKAHCMSRLSPPRVFYRQLTWQPFIGRLAQVPCSAKCMLLSACYYWRRCSVAVMSVDFPPCARSVADFVGKLSAYESANYANSAFHPFAIGKWVVIHVLTRILEEYISPTPFIDNLGVQVLLGPLALLEPLDLSTFLKTVNCDFVQNSNIDSTRRLLPCVKSCQWEILVNPKKRVVYLGFFANISRTLWNFTSVVNVL